jgi:creatinine amidohydrolase
MISQPRLEEVLSKKPTFIVIVGSLEQHARHLPLGTDVIIPVSIAERLAEEMTVLIAPPIGYGILSGNMSGGGRAFSGTICISGAALETMLSEVLSEFIAQGARRILVLNGHSENDSSILVVLNRLMADRRDAKSLLIDWWNMVRPEFAAKRIPAEAQPLLAGHASYLETLMLMAVKPELVKLEELRPSQAEHDVKYEILPVKKEAVPRDGVAWPDDKTVKPSLTPELARATFDEIFKSILQAVKRDLA